MNPTTSRTGWSLNPGDIVRRRASLLSTEYEVINKFRGYGGGGLLVVIRHPDGTKDTVPAESVFTVS